MDNDILPVLQLSPAASKITQLYLDEETIEDSFQKRLKAQQAEIARNQQVIDSQMKTLEQQTIMLAINNNKIMEQSQIINNQNISIQNNSNNFANLNQQCQTLYHQMMEFNNKVIEYQTYLEQQNNERIYNNQMYNNQNYINNQYYEYEVEPPNKSKRKNKISASKIHRGLNKLN